MTHLAIKKKGGVGFYSKSGDKLKETDQTDPDLLSLFEKYKAKQ